MRPASVNQSTQHLEDRVLLAAAYVTNTADEALDFPLSDERVGNGNPGQPNATSNAGIVQSVVGTGTITTQLSHILSTSDQSASDRVLLGTDVAVAASAVAPYHTLVFVDATVDDSEVQLGSLADAGVSLGNQSELQVEVPKGDRGGELTDTQLSPVLGQSIGLWLQSSLPSDVVNRIRNLAVTIEDLPDGKLGESRDGAICIDINAAGYGWFVDSTPAEHSEFIQDKSTHLTAVAGSEADGRIDLLSVLMHETGHVPGLDHDSDLSVMGEMLGQGQRYVLPSNETLKGISLADGPVAGPQLIGNHLDLSGETAGLTITLTDVGATFNVTVSGATVDLSHNATFNDVLQVTGGTGGDVFTLVSGADTAVTIVGGDGDDRLVIENNSTNGVTFQGDAGTDAIVNQSGTTGSLTTTGIESLIDRPLLFIHGFGGSFARDTTPAGVETYLLTRGIAPTELQPEPLSNSDRDLVQTIENVGYVSGTVGGARS